uniref:Uncharacterized protein n=1 Tax=Chromera velia CCMP2878 TaxID=1169474 RepID=A0A0G4GFF8_9ALVE|eukprot:Cvel_21568.t1-p1 / transcript=Cvel_21568.t1 / gene=Cvel_21568 / organism=Chromera_velia_CCMP2878 / gene_product=GTP-binding nuclear protein Ran, putative / transcript_product=GTP-binding nuclear protein Ran, putative / location=Cvel_scaffold2034:23720-34195(+) / protein_length=1598 / sequence_SO=supercontig / SO=protein_coding / is_pseudo=false
MNGHAPGAPQAPKSVKCVVLGDARTGKSSFPVRLRGLPCPENYSPTMGVDVSPVRVEIDGEWVDVNMWCCAGKEEFSGLRDGYYIAADCALIFFDVTQQKSFQSIPSRIADFRRITGENCPVCVVGNFCDVPRGTDPSKREVGPETAGYHEMRRTLKVFEVSTLTSSPEDLIEPLRWIVTETLGLSLNTPFRLLDSPPVGPGVQQNQEGAAGENAGGDGEEVIEEAGTVTEGKSEEKTEGTEAAKESAVQKALESLLARNKEKEETGVLGPFILDLRGPLWDDALLSSLLQKISESPQGCASLLALSLVHTIRLHGSEISDRGVEALCEALEKADLEHEKQGKTGEGSGENWGVLSSLWCLELSGCSRVTGSSQSRLERLSERAAERKGRSSKAQLLIDLLRSGVPPEVEQSIGAVALRLEYKYFRDRLAVPAETIAFTDKCTDDAALKTAVDSLLGEEGGEGAGTEGLLGTCVCTNSSLRATNMDGCNFDRSHDYPSWAPEVSYLLLNGLQKVTSEEHFVRLVKCLTKVTRARGKASKLAEVGLLRCPWVGKSSAEALEDFVVTNCKAGAKKFLQLEFSEHMLKAETASRLKNLRPLHEVGVYARSLKFPHSDSSLEDRLRIDSVSRGEKEREKNHAEFLNMKRGKGGWFYATAAWQPEMVSYSSHRPLPVFPSFVFPGRQAPAFSSFRDPFANVDNNSNRQTFFTEAAAETVTQGFREAEPGVLLDMELFQVSSCLVEAAEATQMIEAFVGALKASMEAQPGKAPTLHTVRLVQWHFADDSLVSSLESLLDVLSLNDWSPVPKIFLDDCPKISKETIAKMEAKRTDTILRKIERLVAKGCDLGCIPLDEFSLANGHLFQLSRIISSSSLTGGEKKGETGMSPSGGSQSPFPVRVSLGRVVGLSSEAVGSLCRALVQTDEEGGHKGEGTAGPFRLTCLDLTSCVYNGEAIDGAVEYLCQAVRSRGVSTPPPCLSVSPTFQMKMSSDGPIYRSGVSDPSCPSCVETPLKILLPVDVRNETSTQVEKTRRQSVCERLSSALVLASRSKVPLSIDLSGVAVRSSDLMAAADLLLQSEQRVREGLVRYVQRISFENTNVELDGVEAFLDALYCLPCTYTLENSEDEEKRQGAKRMKGIALEELNLRCDPSNQDTKKEKRDKVESAPFSWKKGAGAAAAGLQSTSSGGPGFSAVGRGGGLLFSAGMPTANASDHIQKEPEEMGEWEILSLRVSRCSGVQNALGRPATVLLEGRDSSVPGGKGNAIAMIGQYRTIWREELLSSLTSSPSILRALDLAQLLRTPSNLDNALRDAIATSRPEHWTHLRRINLHFIVPQAEGGEFTPKEQTGLDIFKALGGLYVDTGNEDGVSETGGEGEKSAEETEREREREMDTRKVSVRESFPFPFFPALREISLKMDARFAGLMMGGPPATAASRAEKRGEAQKGFSEPFRVLLEEYGKSVGGLIAQSRHRRARHYVRVMKEWAHAHSASGGGVSRNRALNAALLRLSLFEEKEEAVEADSLSLSVEVSTSLKIVVEDVKNSFTEFKKKFGGALKKSADPEDVRVPRPFMPGGISLFGGGAGGGISATYSHCLFFWTRHVSA